MLLSGLIGSLVLSGTATTAVASAGGVQASQLKPTPTGQAALARNPIYKTGKFDFRECKELALAPGDTEKAQLYAKEPRLYMDHLLGCLHDAWATEFRQAGLRFAKPKVQYITSLRQRTVCGTYPRGALGIYCQDKRAMVILLNRNLLADPTSLDPLHVIAHEYAHHAQKMSGAFDVVNRRWSKLSTAGRLEYIRRLELQADCYAGAFEGAIWHSLDRDEFDVEDLQDRLGTYLTHGKAKNRAYWHMRGWKSESPGSCNTWAASRARVA